MRVMVADLINVIRELSALEYTVLLLGLGGLGISTGITGMRYILKR